MLKQSKYRIIFIYFCFSTRNLYIFIVFWISIFFWISTSIAIPKFVWSSSLTLQCAEPTMTVTNIWDLARVLWLHCNLFEICQGKKLIVDVSVCFHSFATFEALDLVLSKKIDGILTKLNVRKQCLLDHGITPIFVFDGRVYPANPPQTPAVNQTEWLQRPNVVLRSMLATS